MFLNLLEMFKETMGTEKTKIRSVKISSKNFGALVKQSLARIKQMNTIVIQD